MEREYIVSLKEGVDYYQFWYEMENPTAGILTIPDRRIDIINNRDGSTRSCHYALSAAEADILQKDHRVCSVEIPPNQRSDIVIGLRSTQAGNFTKTIDNAGDFLNYGMRRCISEVNPYGVGSTVTGNYNYPLDGTGVDIVIQDSGLQIDHPEFLDKNGVSRVQQIDWYAASGLSGTQSLNHYRDHDGHGTHVTGTAAGLTYGWAKNSRIYAVKISGLEGEGDSGTGISVTDCFDVIKLWHRNKPVDPVTGLKRPTIVNMSWGYGFPFSNIAGGVYRGNVWTGSTRRTDFGMIGVFRSSVGANTFDVRVGSVDVDVEELLAEGVHVCVAAGNSFQKIDVPGGLDYDNYFNYNNSGVLVPQFYHRGGSPTGTNAILIGSTDRVVFDAVTEQKSTFSNCGPGITVYAPGSNIMSAASNIVTGFTTANYYGNSNFKQMNISGTSMASPQVCGLGALHLQINPKLTPLELKNRMITDSLPTIYSTNLNNDYTNSRSISNGERRFLYQKYNSPTPYQLKTGLKISDPSFELKYQND